MHTKHTPTEPILYTFQSADDLTRDLAKFIYQTQAEAIDKRRKFTLALSGGSLPKMLHGLEKYKELEGKPGAVEWDRWHIYLADERVVRLDHPECNYFLCKNELLNNVPIPAGNIHCIDVQPVINKLLKDHPVPTGVNRNKHIDDLLAQIDEDTMEEIADLYNDQLVAEFAQKDSARFPVFDLIMLGMGPDGHTASLFPGHKLLAEQSSWVVPIMEAPKPPPNRVTFTYPVINHAAKVAFVASGAGKQDILKQVLDEPEKGLPSSRVKPIAPGAVFWFVDNPAAEKTQYKRTPFKL